MVQSLFSHLVTRGNRPLASPAMFDVNVIDGGVDAAATCTLFVAAVPSTMQTRSTLNRHDIKFRALVSSRKAKGLVALYVSLATYFVYRKHKH